MAKFLTGNGLNAELENIFDKAESKLILISPYIKLHDRYASTLKTKRNNPNLEIIIVFGKNEEDMSRSMKQEDFNFFKEFPNIKICYEKRLHAKYYSNENSAILTSMNLYSYSQDNNIEAGVMTKATLLGNLASNIMTNITKEDSFDDQASNYFQRVIEQAEPLFHKEPQFESAMLGFSKKYKESIIKYDQLSDFFSNKQKYDSKPSHKEYSEKKTFEQPIETKSTQTGYCIRTGVEIPFNVEKPMCYDAYKSWSKFGDKDYAEKFCHFSGEQSHGETSVSKPILKKNWKKAKENFDL